jgi:dolichol-phosphate mannosyltransferase
MDAGWTHSPYDVERLLDTVGDLVIGTRQFHWEGWRTGLSQLAAWLMGVEDATSGFRKWDVRLLRKMALGAVKSRGFAFQLETLVLAMKAGASVGKVPSEYRLTNSSLKPWMIAEAARVYLGKVVLNGLYT